MQINQISPISEDDDELHLPALVYAASLGDLTQVAELLQEGVDPNQTDEEGYSALHAAAENDHLEVVKLLIEKGADVSFVGDYSALQLAEMAENVDVVAYLKSL